MEFRIKDNKPTTMTATLSAPFRQRVRRALSRAANAVASLRTLH